MQKFVFSDHSHGQILRDFHKWIHDFLCETHVDTLRKMERSIRSSKCDRKIRSKDQFVDVSDANTLIFFLNKICGDLNRLRFLEYL